jgi:flagellar basal-body rod protein FlgB
MDLKLIDTSHSKLMGKALDAYNMRQKAIASNVSNIDTPGYKRLEVSFEEQLAKADKLKFSENTKENVRPKMQEMEEGPQLEDEMFTLADTQIRVQLVTRALRHNFGLLKASIIGRNQ